MTSFPPRPMTPAERAALEKVLSIDFVGVEQLRAQVESALVVSRCDCGCPTFDLAVAASAPKAQVERSPVPSELRDNSLEQPGEVILFVEDGYLRSLEYVSPTGTPPAEWPDADTLDPL